MLATIPVFRFCQPTSAGHSHLYTEQRTDMSPTNLYHQQPPPSPKSSSGDIHIQLLPSLTTALLRINVTC
ncbi:hypothetical protein HanHA300_Chr04g0138521 [Helianthus annuus]|nr:hypothetical protein HanHA300_Chr04g0138521 [Helianthus annuus]KAJ0597175.1 hypothetical protein HanHA89_Chr04g0151481 [Helianthus annuus]KAJ0757855.1 hypothetical protein HanLR1_Chr04g0143561 [Helianthus annuus]